MTNIHGLNRAIPADVKRAVRQRCGFGCIICGASIYEYDHFNPEYSDARFHDPAGITLLCPTHHAEKTRRTMPNSIVEDSDRDPASVRSGQTSIVRPYFDHIPSLSLGGGLLVENTPIPLQVAGVPLIEFLPPEAGSRIARINATITSDDGKHILKIVENEWIVPSGVWDYEWIGQRMTIRDSCGRTSLQITIFPPKMISIDRLRFKQAGFDVVVTQTEVTVNSNVLIGNIASGCRVGMALG